MPARVFIVIFLLFFRYVLGYVESDIFEETSVLRITGNISNINHTNTNCIININKFTFSLDDCSNFSQGDKIGVIGRVEKRVINNIFGEIWLNNATIDVFDNDGRFEYGHLSICEKIASIYMNILPKDESSLLAGIVLGYQKDIGYEFKQMMIKSGTVHMVVASGYNVMLVGGAVLSILFWIVRRKVATVAGIVAMCGYALLAGGQPPVIRALSMMSLITISVSLGRAYLSWWILFLSCSLMLIWDPAMIKSISFQLSVAASTGLIVIDPLLRNLVERKISSVFIQNIIVSSGIQSSISTLILTLPIIWWNFGRVTYIGILSNILIVPLIPILMIFGVLMPFSFGLLNYPVYLLSHFMVNVIMFFGS